MSTTKDAELTKGENEKRKFRSSIGDGKRITLN